MKRLALSGLLLLGCTPEFSGSLVVDGKPFTLTSCRAGQASDFSGVDLIDNTGTKLRLVLNPAGTASAYIFSAGQQVAFELGDCGPFEVHKQSSRINQIHNHEGKAKLSCSKEGRSVSGDVTFKNCH